MMMASAARPARGGDVLAEWAQSLTSQTAGRSRGRPASWVLRLVGLMGQGGAVTCLTAPLRVALPGLASGHAWRVCAPDGSVRRPADHSARRRTRSVSGTGPPPAREEPPMARLVAR
jgi:hypothetical protein